MLIIRGTYFTVRVGICIKVQTKLRAVSEIAQRLYHFDVRWKWGGGVGGRVPGSCQYRAIV